MKRMNDENFDPNLRAYPFFDGVLDHGIGVTPTSVTFQGQKGPIKEVGVNGCQIDAMIKFARLTIEAFNAKFPCRENSLAITKLEEAEMWLWRRRENRAERGVEGLNRP